MKDRALLAGARLLLWLAAITDRAAGVLRDASDWLIHAAARTRDRISVTYLAELNQERHRRLHNGF